MTTLQMKIWFSLILGGGRIGESECTSGIYMIYAYRMFNKVQDLPLNDDR